MAVKYELLITYPSNEKPFQTRHSPYPSNRFDNGGDEEAMAWRDYFRNTMIEYKIDLLKDGEIVIKETQKCR